MTLSPIMAKGDRNDRIKLLSSRWPHDEALRSDATAIVTCWNSDRAFLAVDSAFHPGCASRAVFGYGGVQEVLGIDEWPQSKEVAILREHKFEDL